MITDEKIKKEILDYHQCQKCGFWHNSNQDTYIIKNASWGIVDHYGYCLCLEFGQEGSGFARYFTDLKQIQQMLVDSDVNSVEELVGKPCYGYVDDTNIGHFVRMWRKS